MSVFVIRGICTVIDSMIDNKNQEWYCYHNQIVIPLQKTEYRKKRSH